MMMSPHILPDKMGVFTYMLAGILSLPQVFVAKQWNLVLVNLNVAIAYMASVGQASRIIMIE